MKKLAVGVLVAFVGTTAFATVPINVAKKQNQVKTYYKNVAANKATSKAKAGAHVTDINKYIQQLNFQKSKLVKIRNGSNTNPYAKYNGIWEMTSSSTNLYCNDAQGTVLPVIRLVSRARVSIKANGVVKMTPTEVNQIPGDEFVSGWETIRAFKDGRVRMEGEQRRYSQADGYYDQRYLYNGRFTSKVRFTGTENMEFYYQSYNTTCKGKFTLTGNKVGN